jgi:hypothetical protein
VFDYHQACYTSHHFQAFISRLLTSPLNAGKPFPHEYVELGQWLCFSSLHFLIAQLLCVGVRAHRLHNDGVVLNLFLLFTKRLKSHGYICNPFQKNFPVLSMAMGI